MIKLIFLFTGTLSFGLAVVGVFLPVLPTTPFVLLAIYLFSKGHPEKVNEVLNHPRLNLILRIIYLRMEYLKTQKSRQYLSYG